jgi:DNA ligase-1
MIKDEGYRIMVKPHIVLEIAFDSIQKSDRHHSGFALRFPRIKNIRRDKDVADIDTFQKVKQIYENQIYLMNKKAQ